MGMQQEHHLYTHVEIQFTSSQMVTISTTILAQDHILQDSDETEQCQPAALETP